MDERKQMPSIGRMVHYIDQQGKHRAADVVEVYERGPQAYDVTLFVKAPPAPYFVSEVEEGTTPCTWHWPEFVAPK